MQILQCQKSHWAFFGRPFRWGEALLSFSTLHPYIKPLSNTIICYKALWTQHKKGEAGSLGCCQLTAQTI